MRERTRATEKSKRERETESPIKETILQKRPVYSRLMCPTCYRYLLRVNDGVCVCVFVYLRAIMSKIYTKMYKSTKIYIYLQISIYIYVYLYKYICVYMYKHIYTYTYMVIYIYMNLYKYI